MYVHCMYFVCTCYYFVPTIIPQKHHRLYYYWVLTSITLSSGSISPITEPMARRIFPSQTMAFGLSLFLFTFMFLPTLVILLAVVVFFLIFYPRFLKWIMILPMTIYDLVNFNDLRREGMFLSVCVCHCCRLPLTGKAGLWMPRPCRSGWPFYYNL